MKHSHVVVVVPDELLVSEVFDITVGLNFSKAF